MPVQDLYIGLGSLAYALAKSDGELSQTESDTLDSILQTDEYSQIALYSFRLKKAYNTPLEEAYQFAFRRFAANQADLTPELKERYLKILQQLAQACRGISPEEHALLKRIRKDLGKLSPRKASAVLTGR
jgi:uncharacterized tellurite resistance protein B-like protein